MSLRGEDLRVYFEGVKAVDGVDIKLDQGEILGLIGPNGAGKTTLMNALSGFVPLKSGTVTLGEDTVTVWPPKRLARSGLARTFQNVRLFRGLTVSENVEVAAVGVGLGRREAKRRAAEVLEWVGLSPRAHLPTERLSFGEEQRVGIARAIATRPRFLLLDEPAAGLNEAEGDELVALISRIRESEGCGVLIIEHDMRLVMNLCDGIHVLDNGKTIATGSPDEVQKDDAVITAYLGTRKLGAQAVDRTADETPAPAPGEREEAAELLSVADLHVSYGRVPALRGVSLKVRRGEMVGVVGPNGAGKSTLLLTIAGVLRPVQGSVQFDGGPLQRQAPEDIVRKGISLVPERRHIFAQLTVEENLRVAAATRKEKQETARDIEELYERFPILGERRASRGGNLSGGQQQQLAIARALLTRPQLLLVDEPSLGLAPILVERVFDALAALRDEGVSILLVEQNALATIEMSDRVYVLRRGEIALEGEGTDATIRADIVKSYIDQLGLDVQTTSANEESPGAAP